jgi:hypothetical protein
MAADRTRLPHVDQWRSCSSRTRPILRGNLVWETQPGGKLMTLGGSVDLYRVLSMRLIAAFPAANTNRLKF